MKADRFAVVSFVCCIWLVTIVSSLSNEPIGLRVSPPTALNHRHTPQSKGSFTHTLRNEFLRCASENTRIVFAARRYASAVYAMALCHFARFWLTRRVARSLGDSWASRCQRSARSVYVCERTIMFVTVRLDNQSVKQILDSFVVSERGFSRILQETSVRPPSYHSRQRQSGAAMLVTWPDVVVREINLSIGARDATMDTIPCVFVRTWEHRGGFRDPYNRNFGKHTGPELQNILRFSITLS